MFAIDMWHLSSFLSKRTNVVSFSMVVNEETIILKLEIFLPCPKKIKNFFAEFALLGLKSSFKA